MKSSLIVIFNQDFSKNIPKLEELYSSRFSQVRYLVPTTHARLLQRQYRTGSLPLSVLLTADRVYSYYKKWFRVKTPFSLLNTPQLADMNDRVHQVVGDQYLFYDYIAQASADLLKDDSEWFWFTGDDAVLNMTLNQENFFSAFDLEPSSEVDAIICKAVIGTDDWLTQLQGSVAKTKTILRKLLNTLTPYKNKLHVEREDTDSINEHVCVACADFFGVRRDVLEKSIPLFRQAAEQRLFVEIAVPNILISQAKKPISFDNFTWVRSPSDEMVQEMIDSLSTDKYVFVHPLKLSSIDLKPDH